MLQHVRQGPHDCRTARPQRGAAFVILLLRSCLVALHKLHVGRALTHAVADVGSRALRALTRARRVTRGLQGEEEACVVLHPKASPQGVPADVSSLATRGPRLVGNDAATPEAMPLFDKSFKGKQ
eukprot:CAMPEP_0117563806 /NCGR_PEP_ID=MMETSP0784-20121206/55695_1 /TAXON_ID=39447 /ORGANISM="" /LENGTH=124 /DNA_ID=CAMNT_0005361485 /DNA_START=460 /DNA_END=832 /DNA_ORIENTATION=+